MHKRSRHLAWATVFTAVTTFLLAAGDAGATTINFSTLPTDTTYQSDGLLLESSTGTYAIGNCGIGDVGCLGDPFFSGELTFTFVEPGTADQGSTTSVSFIMCRDCGFRGSSAQVFDPFGALLATIDMNTDLGVDSRTYSYSAASIGSVIVDLGSLTDGVESITFNTPTALEPVPEPTSLLLLATGVAGVAFARFRRRK